MAALTTIGSAASMAIVGGVLGYVLHPLVADGPLSWTDPFNLVESSESYRQFGALQIGAMWALVGYAFGLAME